MYDSVEATGIRRALNRSVSEHWGGYDYRKHLLLVGLCLLVLFIRLPSLYVGGNFIAEDGWVFFAGAYNGIFPSSLFQPYAGYFHFLPRLIAEICMLAGYVLQPYLYVMLSAVIVSCILTLFYTPGFRILLPSDSGRMLVVVLLALCHNSENLGLVLGLHWYLAFAVVLICCVPLPCSVGGKVVFFLLSFFAAWSSPSVLAICPFLLWRIWRPLNQQHRWWSLFTLLNVAIVFLFVLWMRIDLGTRTGEYRLWDIFSAAEHVLIRGWLAGTFLGEGFSVGVGGLWSGMLDVIGFGVGFGVIGMYLFVRKHACLDGKSLMGLAMIFFAAIFMLGLSLTRTLYIEETAMSLLPRHTRYLSAPSLLLTIVFWSFLWEIGKKRILWLWMLWSVQVAVLVVTMNSAKHWTRELIYFPWSEQVAAIEAFTNENPGKSDSLYIPSDVPYWGPVLIKNGGYQHLPEDGFEQIRGISSSSSKYEDAWFGSFDVLNDGPMIKHEILGLVEYQGEYEGRVWFRNKQDVLYFSSPLMNSQYWMMKGTDFTLLTNLPLSP